MSNPSVDRHTLIIPEENSQISAYELTGDTSLDFHNDLQAVGIDNNFNCLSSHNE